MAKKRDKPLILVRKRGDTLYPSSGYDAEQLAQHGDGVEFSLTRMTRRSTPQNRLYWSMLSRVVEATDKWPNSEHLHDALKRDLGFMTVSYSLDGTPFVTTDSTAFDAMNHEEFQNYLDRAMARLAEAVGCDPLDMEPA